MVWGYKLMFSRVLYGSLYDFIPNQDSIEMYVDREYVASMPASTSVERDIGLMMLAYVE